MRESLFRGFHACKDGGDKIKLNGETITGDWIEGQVCSDGKKSWIVYDMDFFIEEDVGGAHLISDRFMAVVPETVGQFTGLTDTNGKRIFEGDILQLCKATYPCLVYWNGTGWSIKRNGKRVIYACDMDVAHDLRNMEIISNVFEVDG